MEAILPRPGLVPLGNTGARSFIRLGLRGCGGGKEEGREQLVWLRNHTQSCPLFANRMNASSVTTRTRFAWTRCSFSAPEVK